MGMLRVDCRVMATRLGRLGVWPILLLTVLLIGCTTTVIPPPSPAEAVKVYLLDHGRHPSLVMPTPEGHLVRYAYGDWSWYALARTGSLEAVRAVFWCNPAALGRREYGSADLNAILGQAPAVHVYQITVSGGDVEQLRGELNAVFERNISTLHANEEYCLDFVRDPRPYSGIHNCNHVMSSWLRQLNCEVNGLSFLCKWRVVGAAD